MDTAIADLLSEAAVEIENLDGRNNIVAQRLRAQMRSMMTDRSAPRCGVCGHPIDSRRDPECDYGRTSAKVEIGRMVESPFPTA